MLTVRTVKFLAIKYVVSKDSQVLSDQICCQKGQPNSRRSKMLSERTAKFSAIMMLSERTVKFSAIMMLSERTVKFSAIMMLYVFFWWSFLHSQSTYSRLIVLLLKVFLSNTFYKLDTPKINYLKIIKIWKVEVLFSFPHPSYISPPSFLDNTLHILFEKTLFSWIILFLYELTLKYLKYTRIYF